MIPKQFNMALDAKNGPSRYRALLREAKSTKGNLDRLLDEAKRLKDPYYASLALFGLSANTRLELNKAVSAANEALVVAGRVESLWRRAELLGIIAKKAGSWRGKGAGQNKERLLDGILDAVLSMPKGKGLLDATVGCAPRIGCNRIGSLLAKAVSNRGFEVEGSRAVIRYWAKSCDKEGPRVEEVTNILKKVDDSASRSKLFGYLHLQCKKSKRPCGTESQLHLAVEAGLSIKGEEQLDALGYLAKQATTGEELEVVAGVLERLKEPASRARLMASLGASADRAGKKEMALDFFNHGLETSSQIENTKERSNVMKNLEQGIERVHMGDVKLRKKKSEARVSHVEQRKSVNDMLALYDTYEGGLGPVHTRAVARAAPLCAAFGLDLGLLGFPTDDLEGLIKMVTSDTKVGRSGKYLKELAGQGRVMLVPATQKRPPENWDELGLPVATTSHPRDDKKVDMAKAVRLSKSLHPLKRVCFIMGLGKRGLPPSLLDAAPYHLELTGSNIPLETATAMGVIAQLLASER
jgi:hypothetical protein